MNASFLTRKWRKKAVTTEERSVPVHPCVAESWRAACPNIAASFEPWADSTRWVTMKCTWQNYPLPVLLEETVSFSNFEWWGKCLLTNTAIVQHVPDQTNLTRGQKPLNFVCRQPTSAAVTTIGQQKPWVIQWQVRTTLEKELCCFRKPPSTL